MLGGWIRFLWFAAQKWAGGRVLIAFQWKQPKCTKSLLHKMTNTLAHIGLQGLATRRILGDADFKWIYLGCIIPDIPWIFQRLIRFTFSDINVYDLRLYATVQASLLFCFLLSLSLATISKSFWKAFIILSINSFLFTDRGRATLRFWFITTSTVFSSDFLP